ncbi:MAG: hypothetical protein QOG48_1941 [Verrucomicrobiota bacterium]|jgi:hypothetical protein
MNWRNIMAGALLIVGLAQMAGDLTKNLVVKGIAAATAISPCPKVFCDMNGLEPFASTFTLTANGRETISLPITPQLYARLKGPYNRRNVYGAAVAAAPILPEQMRQSVLRYAFKPGGPLRRNLGLADDARIALTVHSNTRGRNETWTFDCAQ